MTLARRLLLGSVIVIVALVTATTLVAGSRLRNRLQVETEQDLLRSARLVALLWHPGQDADSLADAAGAALQRRVTLIAASGVVQGDSKFTPQEITGLENHSTRPEVIEARAEGWGSSRRHSVSAGDDEMYVAVRHPMGFVRVAINLGTLREIVWAAQRDVLTGGLVALIVALLLAAVFVQTVSRPVIELRDVARAVADGDLTRRPHLDAPGEVGDLAAAVHRMTEQLAGRLAAVQAGEALLRATIEALDEGIIAVDARHQVVRINQSARRMLDVTDAVPFPADRLPPDRILREALRSAIEGIATDTAEITRGERTLGLSARTLEGGGAVLALQDLTTRRRLESIRRDFVANASHELKTPLTVVSGFAETLQDPDIPVEDRQRFAGMIRTSAHRMQRIVDDLLDLSRYESGTWRPNPVAVDLPTAVSDVLTTASPAAADKGLTLARDLAGDAAKVYADATALRQILANLVDNALRYTASGTVTVFSRREGSSVRVGVRDTGIGIAAEHLPRIFERFYRVDPARSRAGGGTGLGLAIVRHLAEAHGGSVHAESALGQGTTISVVLPDAAPSTA
ncbi:MAG TPA: ATP-binding protein [Gemmatimonadaceae bacterium]|nr:ATP-binding protein [Gemmatimonadaceae bacterium]